MEKEKKVCIISANCQGAYIKALLGSHPEFSSDFEIFYFVNYKKERIPVELLKKADVLIYQPLSKKWGELSSEYLEEHAPKAFKIRIPALTFPVYWPTTTENYSEDPRNVVNEEYPFGQFPYVDRYILYLLRQGTDKEEIFRRVCSKDILKFVDVDKVLEEYIEFQKDIETRRDLKLLDFILDNFRKHKLFETYNHPSKILAFHQVNCLLEKLGYRHLRNNEVTKFEYLSQIQQVIHPHVAEALKLEFEADWGTKYMIWFKSLTALDYYRAYIYWDLTVIGKPEECNLTYVKLNRVNSQNSPKFVSKKFPSIAELELYRKNVVEKQLFFIDIPGTNGLYIHRVLSKSLFGIDEYKRFNDTMELIRDCNFRIYPLVSGPLFFDCYKILSKELIIFTFLMNPVQRTISEMESKNLKLEDLLSNELTRNSISNIQTKLLGKRIEFNYYYSLYLNGKLTKDAYYQEIAKYQFLEVTEEDFIFAKKVLENLFFFGLVETLDRDIKKLLNILGLGLPKDENKSHEVNVEVDMSKYKEQELTKIKELNKFDMELYNYAKRLYTKRFGE